VKGGEGKRESEGEAGVEVRLRFRAKIEKEAKVKSCRRPERTKSQKGAVYGCQIYDPREGKSLVSRLLGEKKSSGKKDTPKDAKERKKPFHRRNG